MSPKEAILRRARISDHSAMASVFATAFFEDILFGREIHPYRHQYPADCELYWLRRIQQYWWHWAHVFLVTTVVVRDESSGRQQEVITGVAHWSRLGDCAKVAGYGLSSRIWPNRAADPNKEFMVEKSYPFTEHYWSPELERYECWNLEHLAVHPDCQNHGLGRKLVQWGMQRADEEDLATSVVSAVTAEDFYRKCGFDVGPVGWSGEGEGNPLANIPGGAILFRDAKHVREGRKS